MVGALAGAYPPAPSVTGLEDKMSQESDAIAAAAERIRAAYDTGVPCPPLRDSLPAGNVTAAYAVQELNTLHWLKQGRRIVGRKIGITSVAVQQLLGVDQPDYGILFADMAVGDGEEVAVGRVMQPRTEAEIAFILERDLPHEKPTVVDVIRAVAYALPAIEIVGSRVADWNIKSVDTIADNASSGLFVLGGPPRKLDGLDLRQCGMVMERRGDPVSVGAGLACLGHPLNAAVWLAGKMAEVGRPLQAGDVIMSGALGPMVPAKPGDVLEARISGLGSVRAVFAKGAEA
jgi:2-keto-4-pentenoate hydratase